MTTEEKIRKLAEGLALLPYEVRALLDERDATIAELRAELEEEAARHECTKVSYNATMNERHQAAIDYEAKLAALRARLTWWMDNHKCCDLTSDRALADGGDK